ncbi:MAG: Fe-S protein assembly co-chaperone HscB [Azoarcus sp.]|jgi:molecular chaperone HscB|nr:Fe-S protein assembly co-chaperone HscB [Azoarcus sp.]
MSVNFSLDYFALFGLPRRFDIDEAELDRAWHALQAEVHPDRHVHLPGSERHRAMRGALRVNEAYATLKKPLSRARYLLDLAGVDADEIDNVAMASGFLIEQMEWREAVEEARAFGDVDALEQLALRLRMRVDEVTTLLAEQFDSRENREAAADTVRRLMFLDRLRCDIDDGLAALDD